MVVVLICTFTCVSCLQLVSRVDIKYKRMNSSERVRIINSGISRLGVETLRPEGECKRACVFSSVVALYCEHDFTCEDILPGPHTPLG